MFFVLFNILLYYYYKMWFILFFKFQLEFKKLGDLSKLNHNLLYISDSNLRKMIILYITKFLFFIYFLNGYLKDEQKNNWKMKKKNFVAFETYEILKIYYSMFGKILIIILIMKILQQN